jgi:hypothetical protein
MKPNEEAAKFEMTTICMDAYDAVLRLLKDSYLGYSRNQAEEVANKVRELLIEELTKHYKESK